MAFNMSDVMSGPLGTPTNAVSTAIIGPVVLGELLGITLFGLLVPVAWRYVHTTAWKSSPTWMRVAVALVLLLTAATNGFYVYDIWSMATKQDRSLDALLRSTISMCFEPALIGAIGALVEALLVLRAAKLIRRAALRRILLGLSSISILVGFLGALGTTIWLFNFWREPLLQSQIVPTFNNCVAIWLTASAVVDVGITVVYIIQLSGLRAGFNSTTDSALSKVLSTILKSAAYTSILAVGGAAVSWIFDSYSLKTIDVAWALFLPLASLYTLSLFTTLDVRNQLSCRLSGVIGALPPQSSVMEHRPPSRRSRDVTVSTSSSPYTMNPQNSALSVPRQVITLPTLRNAQRYGGDMAPCSPESKYSPPLFKDGVLVNVEFDVQVEDHADVSEFDEYRDEPRLLGTRMQGMTAKPT